VVFIDEVAWLPHTIIHCGEVGTVVALEVDCAGLWQIEVKLDSCHEGLAAWKNEVLITEPELSCVESYTLGNSVLTEGINQC
jgi:hypothetical protein